MITVLADSMIEVGFKVEDAGISAQVRQAQTSEGAPFSTSLTILANGMLEVGVRHAQRYDLEEEPEIPEQPFRERRRPPSVEDLPTEAPPDRTHGFAVTDLREDGGYQNIKRLMTLANEEEIDYWANWYPIAHRESQKLAQDMGVPLEVAAGVIAVLSPGVRWEENVALAEDVILRQDELRQKLTEMYDERGRLKPFEDRPTLGLAAKHPEFVRKALAILEANDPMVGQPRGVKGPKVEVFYNSMVDPQGTSRDIVLDGHAINLWRGAKDQPITGTTVTKPQRTQIAEDYRRVGDEYGLSPQEIQAITWSLWRAMKKHPQRPGTRMNLMAQLEAIDPDAVALMAELNGLTIEQVMEMLNSAHHKTSDVYTRDKWQRTLTHKDILPTAHYTEISEVARATFPGREDESNYVRATLPVSKLVAGQDTVYNPSGHRQRNLALPMVLPMKDGRYLINDGHHRIVDAVLTDGATEVDVLVYDGPRKDGVQRQASRMTFIDDTQRQGEVELAEAKPGDSVRFTRAFEKPGWPRVDAGEVGRIRAVSPGTESLEVEVLGAMPYKGGVEVKSYAVEVPSSSVALLLNGDDPRTS